MSSSTNAGSPSDDERVDAGAPALPIDELMRRSSPLPIRRPPSPLDAAPSRSQASPLRLNRPRSNPRNRTPMRYESPLNADAFRRDRTASISEEPEDVVHSNEGRRITIRPMAGAAVGTVAQTRIREERQVQAPARSRKQGPSTRKIRRWNNDNFVGLGLGRQAAEVLLKASSTSERMAHRDCFDPTQHESAAMRRFMNDDMKSTRERFFEGEIGPKAPRESKPRRAPAPEDDDMLLRIDPRLRRILVKACSNSLPACKVVDALERCLLEAFADGSHPPEDSWKDILAEPPRLVSPTSLRFAFDAESSTGGFHRLLLHGLCQFHGLSAVPSSVRGRRLLTAIDVNGGFVGPDVRLVGYISNAEEEPQTVMEMTGAMAALKAN